MLPERNFFYIIYDILNIKINLPNNQIKFIVAEPWKKIPALYRFNLDTVGAGFLSAIFKIKTRRRKNWESILSCHMGWRVKYKILINLFFIICWNFGFNPSKQDDESDNVNSWSIERANECSMAKYAKPEKQYLLAIAGFFTKNLKIWNLNLVIIFVVPLSTISLFYSRMLSFSSKLSKWS